MSSPYLARATLSRRPGLRIGLVLLGLLATVLVASLLIQRESPTTTILVADLRQDLSGQIDEIQKKAAEGDVDLVLFVAPLGRLDTNADLVQEVQKAGPKPVMLVVSQQGAAADVRKKLPSTVRVAYLDGENQEIRLESSGVKPGLLRLATWALALLAIGALVGRVLLPRARPAGPRSVSVGPSLAPERQLRVGAQRPAVVPQVRGVANLGWRPQEDADTSPPRGVVDLRPFHKASTVDSWTAQCPYCGAFGPRTWDKDGDSHYRCVDCEEEWQVRAGEPWPTVVIRPRHRRAD